MWETIVAWGVILGIIGACVSRVTGGRRVEIHVTQEIEEVDECSRR